MRTVIAGALLLISIASCALDENESTETDGLYGIGAASPRWGTTSGAAIPVCWDAPDTHIDLEIRVRELLRESWESYANISFIGPVPSEPFGGLWGPCSDLNGRKIRVVFSDAPTFRSNTQVTPGETTVYLFADHANDDRATEFRSVVIHEFGHALGFNHEQQRPDNWATGTAAQCGVPVTDDDFGNYAPVAGGLYLTPAYDVNSIMNYCNPQYPLDLSVGDIRGVRAAYGRRDVKGDIYRVGADNQLHWYRHDGRVDGSGNWAYGSYGSGSPIGQGWAVKDLFSGGGSLGILYTVDANNTLRWYRHNGRVDGGFRWTYGSGTEIGWGWNFKRLFGAGDGVIYGVVPYVPAHYDLAVGNVPASGGQLKWYKNLGEDDGTYNWATASGTTIGSRWDSFEHVFYAGNGVIYGITPYIPGHYESTGGGYIAASGGELRWYRHLGRADGLNSWAPGSGKILGRGWGTFKKVFSGGDGVIYVVDQSDRLLWYRHDGRDTGGSQWAAGSGTPVGSGWTFQHLVGDD